MYCLSIGPTTIDVTQSDFSNIESSCLHDINYWSAFCDVINTS